jgi:hypothetical protein
VLYVNTMTAVKNVLLLQIGFSEYQAKWLSMLLSGLKVAGARFDVVSRVPKMESAHMKNLQRVDHLILA